MRARTIRMFYGHTFRAGTDSTHTQTHSVLFALTGASVTIPKVNYFCGTFVCSLVPTRNAFQYYYYIIILSWNGMAHSTRMRYTKKCCVLAGPQRLPNKARVCRFVCVCCDAMPRKKKAVGYCVMRAADLLAQAGGHFYVRSLARLLANKRELPRDLCCAKCFVSRPVRRCLGARICRLSAAAAVAFAASAWHKYYCPFVY